MLPKLKAGAFDEASEMCEAKSLRALPRLVLTVIANRRIGYEGLREQVGELIQRDLMATARTKDGLGRHDHQKRPVAGPVWYGAEHDRRVRSHREPVRRSRRT